MQHKKILLITNNYPPMSGGISRYLFEIITNMPPQMIQVVGFRSKGWREFDKKQAIKIERLNIPRFLRTVGLYKSIKENDVAIVLCGSAKRNLLLASWLNWKFDGIPYGVFVYGLDILSKQTQWDKCLFNALLRSARLIITISRATYEIIRSLGIDQNRIYLLNPAINSSGYDSNVLPETIKKRYGLLDKKCILTVGRLVKRKGHDTIINAMPLILDTIPNAHYLIVGNGPYENSLRKLVVELGLESHVTFAGHISDEELGSCYSLCDVFAMVSREISEKGDIEGFGIVYLEANLFKKPVVAGRSGGVEDAVKHNQNGLLVDPYSSKDVTEAIISILTNPTLANRLGKVGHEMVINDFSSKESSKKLLDIINSIKYR